MVVVGSGDLKGVTRGRGCGLHKRVEERTKNKFEEGRKMGERKHIGGERK